MTRSWGSGVPASLRASAASYSALGTGGGFRSELRSELVVTPPDEGSVPDASSNLSVNCATLRPSSLSAASVCARNNGTCRRGGGACTVAGVRGTVSPLSTCVGADVGCVAAGLAADTRVATTGTTRESCIFRTVRTMAQARRARISSGYRASDFARETPLASKPTVRASPGGGASGNAPSRGSRCTASDGVHQIAVVLGDAAPTEP